MGIYFREVDGINEQGKKTKFKLEIPQRSIDKITAFDLIVNKEVDIVKLKQCTNVISYNSQVYTPPLKPQEFEFLKIKEKLL